MTSVIPIPPPLKAFFAHFPLYTHPAIQTRERQNCSKSPTLWIHPPFDPSSSFLSSDIECLKWQAYIALRGLSNISVRWDLPPDAGIDGHLPNLCTYSESAADYELLDRQMIPSWVDTQVPPDGLDGFNGEEAKFESAAWISLLEGTVHAAVVRSAHCVPQYVLTPPQILAEPPKSLLSKLTSPPSFQSPTHPLGVIFAQPLAPFSGLSSIIPPSGTQVDVSGVFAEYKNAVLALSDRLGEDKWFLESRLVPFPLLLAAISQFYSNPTALDALLFAYLHSILSSSHEIRLEVTRRANLVAWHYRVLHAIRPCFVAH
jgi:metaxin